jgi:hypothetical protein
MVGWEGERDVIREGWCTLVRRSFLIDLDRKGRCICQKFGFFR